MNRELHHKLRQKSGFSNTIFDYFKKKKFNIAQSIELRDLKVKLNLYFIF